MRKIIPLVAMAAIVACSPQDKKQKETLDVSLINTEINPAEDFYAYANEGWEKANPLPDDESRFGSFDQLAKGTSEKVNTLVTDLAASKHEQGSLEQKIGDFYALGMNTELIEKQGITPLKAELERINKISNLAEVREQIRHFHQYGIGTAFSFYGSSDAKNAEMVIAHLNAGGLGMSDRDYYVKDDERSQELRKEYVKLVTNMLELSGEETAKATADAALIMDFETKLAKVSMTRLERRDPHKTYNKQSIEEVNKNYPNLDMNTYLAFFGIKVDEINISQPVFMETLNKLIPETSIDTWKAYFRWNLINETASFLSSDFVNRNFDFYGKTLSGSPKMKDRWRRVLATTTGALGDPIGQIFVKKYFPAEAKTRMVNLVENLRTALGQRIEKLDWMSEETKTKAKDKLASMRVKIGYPDQWKDYSKLEVVADSYVQNVLNANRFHIADELEKIGKPMDKNQWFFPPQTVNAYYAPSLNEICFPAGILQPPFFYIDGDDAINYGAIGAVIGHEMTHGFDDKGRLFSKEGNLENWWTEEDAKLFGERTKVLVEQFNKIEVLPEVMADGELTLGENIADLGALNIAYQALENAQNGKTPEKVDGFTPEQRFYLSWARVWAQNIRDKEILRRTQEDVHSLGKYRVNGPLKNITAFHKAFDVKEGDLMFLPTENRAEIW